MARASAACASFATSTILAFAALTSSCTQSQPDAPSALKDAAAPSDAAPPKIATLTLGDLEPWASPIDDYIAAGKRVRREFDMAINELMPFGDRLFFGYGDATYNLGEKIPIEIRAFTSADDPAHAALPIDGAQQGEAQKTPTQSGEEQIDRFRILDGELWQAGIDSIDPDELWTQSRSDPKIIQGNVYRLERADGTTFQKKRTIHGGEHVHDLASFKGAVYGVGSGADTRIEFEAGRVFRYLWRSDDRGATFRTVQRFECSRAKDSDTRFVHLLATTNVLYLFGYDTVFSTNAGTVENATSDGESVSDLPKGSPLERIVPDGTLSIPGGAGLVWGREIGGAPAALHVAADGAVSPVAALAGTRVLDVSLTSTGEILFMVTTDTTDKPSAWPIRVVAADATAIDDAHAVLETTLATRPASVAWFAGALFVGTADGHVLRASRRN